LRLRLPALRAPEILHCECPAANRSAAPESSRLSPARGAHVAAFELLPGGPWRFLGLDFHRAPRHVDVPGHGIENEELGFRAEIGGVAKSGRLEICFGAVGQRVRVAGVALAVGWLVDIAVY